MTATGTANGAVPPTMFKPPVLVPVPQWERQAERQESDSEAAAPPPAVRQEQRQEERQEERQERAPRRWPLLLIAAPAAVAIWSGWVQLGGMCGFGLVQPLPGIVAWHLDTAITLPVGVEAYGTYALGKWLSPATPHRARTWACISAIGSLVLGMLGQVAYHLLAAAHRTQAPWGVTVVVSCIPVIVVGCAAALVHLVNAGDDDKPDDSGDDTGRDSDSDTDDTEDDSRDDAKNDTDDDRRRQRKPPARDTVTPTIRRHPDWDDDKIAAHCGVSKRTVQRRREAARKEAS